MLIPMNLHVFIRQERVMCQRVLGSTPGAAPTFWGVLLKSRLGAVGIGPYQGCIGAPFRGVPQEGMTEEKLSCGKPPIYLSGGGLS